MIVRAKYSFGSSACIEVSSIIKEAKNCYAGWTICLCPLRKRIAASENANGNEEVEDV
jgi:hypothetical protein